MSISIKRYVQRSAKDSRGFSVVCCEVEGHHKYVTWLQDASGNNHYGDYYARAEDALRGYIERCNDNGVEA